MTAAKTREGYFRNIVAIHVLRDGVKELLAWLTERKFFTERASKTRHNSKEGGLVKHSLDVYYNFRTKIAQYDLNVPLHSAVVASLFHDLCKLGTYRTDHITGELITVDQEPFGHGEKSVILLQKFIKLSDQEIALIRWHMGRFEAGDDRSYERKSWRSAIAQYPEIVAFHCADWESSQYGMGVRTAQGFKMRFKNG
jgi:hypothetical protein